MCGAGGEPGLRGKLIDEQIQARTFLMKCVVGDADFADLEPMVAGSTMISTSLDLPAELAEVDCGDFTQTETEFATRRCTRPRRSFARIAPRRPGSGA